MKTDKDTPKGLPATRNRSASRVTQNRAASARRRNPVKPPTRYSPQPQNALPEPSNGSEP